MANMAAFYETRTALRNFVDYSYPLTFEEFQEVPDDKKVAVLYLQFFNEITLAWDKANTLDFIDGEDGVEITLQYLQKLVCDRHVKGHVKKKVSDKYFFEHPDECEERRMLESDPRNFYAGFIYRVIYNALYCICHDRKCDKDRMENEMFATITCGEDEFSLFDTVSDKKGDASSVSESENFEKEFWSIIEDAGIEAEKVMRYLLSGNESDLKKLSRSCKRYEGDPLRDVEVNKDSLPAILGHLRKRFLSLSQSSPCGSYISTFESVMA